MELTFVHQFSGDTPKRRRLAKACEICRARKKRCIHFAGAEKDHEDKERSGSAEDTNGHATGRAASNGTQRSPSSAAAAKRFISDLNPEATFMPRRPGPHNPDDHRPPNDDIGVWIDKMEWEELVRHRDAANQSRSENRPSGKSRDASQLTYQYGLSGGQRPHSAVLGPLLDVYFKKVHPILPLMDEVEFREQRDQGLAPEPLVHALCLVAAKDAEANVHLKIQQSPSTLPPREFCSRLYGSVMGALRAPCRYDNITLIRILALASMHSEGSDGAEESSMLLSQAMHHAQTMGIHLGQQSNGQSESDRSMKRLFWSLWALDRANSTMNGRPVIMSDIDIAIDKFAPGESGLPAFEVWLRTTEVLNKIIAFYRPNYPMDVTGWEEQYPGLEEIIDDVSGWHLPQGEHLTLHLYYLTVAILSHRSRGTKQIPRGTNSSIRQRLCASEIIRLMESKYAQELHALPIIPYAVSLALSVSYQHLRQSQFQHQQEDACEQFSKCTKILQSLRRTWSSADTMAALAKKVQDEIERAPSLASFRITREAQKQNEVSTTCDNPKAKECNVPCMPSISGARMGLDQPVPTEQAETAEENGTLPTAPASVQPLEQQLVADGAGLFDGMDDVFGTYLDPNYPVNLDDLSFLDDLQPFDYNNAGFEEASKW